MASTQTPAAVALRPDGRRELGERTCQRLLDATLELLASRGEDGFSLREITDAAQTNVAAVSYHFGSKTSLIERAIDHALDRVLDAQDAELQALGEHPTPDGVARALARPVIEAVTGDGRELALLQIIVRATIKRPQGCGARLTAQVRHRRARLLEALSLALPDASAEEIGFRIDCAIGLLEWLALRSGEAVVAGRSKEQLERLLVPMLVGALTAKGS